MSSKQHAAILCSPGMGHLIPVLELGKQLVTHQNFAVTIFIFPSSEAELKAATCTKICDIVQLPPPDTSKPANLIVRMRELRHVFRSAVCAMKFTPTMLIVDLFGIESFPIAEELGIPKYLFFASNAWFLSFVICCPTFDMEVEGNFVDHKEPLKIPGCRELRPRLDVIDIMLDRTDQRYHDFVGIASRIPKCSDGILLNTWKELEPITLAALRDENLLGRYSTVPVYPIGPIIRPNESNSSAGKVFDWLDKQPTESVIFVSFGSGGALSHEQMIEIAWGLEFSQQRFIWVIRSPTVTTADAAYFTTDGDVEGPLKYLPEGFIDRTKNLGLVIPLWAPQVEILSHPSVGGFLSHCGWSSTLESLTNGVPMIVWPLFAEQRTNATLLAEELGVAVRSKVPPWKKVVERKEIEEMVRMIMEDQKGLVLRERMKKLKESAAKALEEGGSSHNALSQFAKHGESMYMQLANVNVRN
ncbi:hypothetical protein C1H46_005270 [Malus baccata]|uniref:Glycosyltransferase n=1 Tax=Malus baccata TaxID=106549 RepID=A0A540NDJ7_MALBA|nr:hypothetical protein C1H46_005270 [Malus baccata]